MNTSLCTVEDCEREVHVQKRGLCSSHYAMWIKKNPVFKDRPTECTVEGCDKPFYSRNYCRHHYNQWRRWGDPYGAWGKYEPTPCPIHPKRTLNRAGKCGSCVQIEFYHAGRQGTGPRRFKEHVGYEAAHSRIRSDRGHAKDYQCVDCPKQARDWTLSRFAENILIQVGGQMDGSLYSLNIMDYEPRCSDCHTTHDRLYGVKKKHRKHGTSPRYEQQKRRRQTQNKAA